MLPWLFFRRPEKVAARFSPAILPASLHPILNRDSPTGGQKPQPEET